MTVYRKCMGGRYVYTPMADRTIIDSWKCLSNLFLKRWITPIINSCETHVIRETMLKLVNTLDSIDTPIRLDKSQRSTIEKITGQDLEGIKSLKQLEDFIEFHKRALPENIPETRLMRILLERELENARG